MADPYIDYYEIGEYGDHFRDQAKSLVKASPLVDIDHLMKLIGDDVAAVAAELAKQGIDLSKSRTSAVDVEKASKTAREGLTRFHKHLGSLDTPEAHDVGAFFKGGKLGAVSTMKPADLKTKLDDVLRGFDAPANKALPDVAKRKATLVAARDALASTLSGKGTAKTVAIKSTKALIAAREKFLKDYNGVAKHAIQALLNELGRGKEYALFFKDLQVNEAPATKKDKKPAATPPAKEPAPVG